MTNARSASRALYALRQDALSEGTLCEYERRWRNRLGSEPKAQLTLRVLALNENSGWEASPVT